MQWLLPVVFRAVIFKLLFWCGAEGYVSGLQDAATIRFAIETSVASSWHFISTYIPTSIYFTHKGDITTISNVTWWKRLFLYNIILSFMFF